MATYTVHFLYSHQLDDEPFLKSLKKTYPSNGFKWLKTTSFQLHKLKPDTQLVFILSEPIGTSESQLISDGKKRGLSPYIIQLRQKPMANEKAEPSFGEIIHFPKKLDTDVKHQLLCLAINSALKDFELGRLKEQPSEYDLDYAKRQQYALESLNAGVWDLYESENKQEFQWSKRILQLLGYRQTVKKTSLKFIKSITHGNDLKRLKEAFEPRLNPELFPLELRLKTEINGVRWFKITAKNIDSSNTQKRYVGTLEDIQDFKTAQQKLRQNEKRFKKLVDESPIPTFIIQGESVVYANSSTLNLVENTNRRKAVVENVLTLLPAQSVHRISAAGRVVISGRIETAKFDVDINLPKQATISCQVSLTRIDYNNGYALLGTAVNLTERIKNQSLLAEKETALKQAQKLAKIGSWQWTLSSGELKWSDYMYEIFGLTLHQTPTLNMFVEQVVPEDRKLVMKVLDAVNKNRQLNSITYRIITRKGGIKHLRAEAQHVTSDILVGTVQDITETASLELKLLDQKRIMNSVLTGLPIDVALYNSSGEYIYANYHHELDGEKTLMGKTDMHLFNDGKITLETAVTRSEKLEEVIKTKKGIEWSETDDEAKHMVCKLIPHCTNAIVEQILFYRIDLSKEKASEKRLRARADFEKLIIDLFNQLMNTLVNNIDGYMESSLMKIGSFIEADRAYIYQFGQPESSCQNWIKSKFRTNKYRPSEKIKPTRALSNWIKSLSPTETILIGGQHSQPNHLLLQSGLADRRMQSTLIVPLESQRKIIGFLGFEILDKSKTWKLGTQTFLGLSGQVFTNALERKISKSALAASEVKFRTLTENAHAGIFITSEYRIVYANPTASKITGYAYDELLSMSLLELFHKDEQRDARKNGKLLDEGKKSLSRTQRKIVSKNGETRYIDIASNLIDYNGKKSLISIAIDITDNKKSEEEKSQLIQQLTTQNTDLEQFSYITSHNLRSPVAGIQGLVSIIDWDALGGEFNSEILERIKGATNRLDDTIKELNEIISVRKKSSELKRVINIEALIQETQLKHQSLFEDSKARLSIKIDGFENMYATKGYMESIFSNLIVNAIKYRRVDCDPVIKVSSKITRTNATIEIQDNGTGIDLSKFKDKVFKFKQRFHRNIEGSGIGLYLVKTQVEALGGKVSIESKVGEGTTFTLTFPKGHAVQWVKN